MVRRKVVKPKKEIKPEIEKEAVSQKTPKEEKVKSAKEQRLVANGKVEQRKKEGWKEVDISNLKDEALEKVALRNQDCVLMEK